MRDRTSSVSKYVRISAHPKNLWADRFLRPASAVSKTGGFSAFPKYVWVDETFRNPPSLWLLPAERLFGQVEFAPTEFADFHGILVFNTPRSLMPDAGHPPPLWTAVNTYQTILNLFFRSSSRIQA